MKLLNPMNALALVLAAPSIQVRAADMNAPAPVQMEEMCADQIRTAVAALEGSVSVNEAEDVTISKNDRSDIDIKNVKILDAQHEGPADGDAPDYFKYSADVGSKGKGLNGKVIVSYHRGNCFVKRITLGQ